ncbi:hypothetical protein D9M71_817140 [compost metagenome]
MLKIPLKKIVKMIAVKTVTKAAEKCKKLYSPLTFIAIFTAVPESPSPITIITGPTTIGGKIFIIHL